MYSTFLYITYNVCRAVHIQIPRCTIFKISVAQIRKSNGCGWKLLLLQNVMFYSPRVDSVSLYRRVIRNIRKYRFAPFNTQDIQSNHFWLIKIDRFIHSPAWAEQALFSFGQWLIVCVMEFIRNKFLAHCVSSVCATCLYIQCAISLPHNWCACHNSPPPTRKIVPNAIKYWFNLIVQ